MSCFYEQGLFIDWRTVDDHLPSDYVTLTHEKLADSPSKFLLQDIKAGLQYHPQDIRHQKVLANRRAYMESTVVRDGIAFDLDSSPILLEPGPLPTAMSTHWFYSSHGPVTSAYNTFDPREIRQMPDIRDYTRSQEQPKVVKLYYHKRVVHGNTVNNCHITCKRRLAHAPLDICVFLWFLRDSCSPIDLAPRPQAR